MAVFFSPAWAPGVVQDGLGGLDDQRLGLVEPALIAQGAPDLTTGDVPVVVARGQVEHSSMASRAETSAATRRP